MSDTDKAIEYEVSEIAKFTALFLTALFWLLMAILGAYLGTLLGRLV